MKDGIKFFMGQTIEKIEDDVARFLLSNKYTIEIKSFTEIRNVEFSYCFCLVYTKRSTPVNVQRMGVNGEWM